MDNEKHYRCTFTGDYQPELNRTRTEDFSYGRAVRDWPELARTFTTMEVGDTAVDFMGDTWERIA